MRRLLIVSSMGAPGDGRHQCLVPVDGEPPYALMQTPFTCSCGETFRVAALEALSWTTEYDRRCLNAFSEIVDNRAASGRPIQ